MGRGIGCTAAEPLFRGTSGHDRVGSDASTTGVRATVLQPTAYALAAELLGTPHSDVVARASSVVEQLSEFAAVEKNAVRA